MEWKILCVWLRNSSREAGHSLESAITLAYDTYGTVVDSDSKSGVEDGTGAHRHQ